MTVSGLTTIISVVLSLTRLSEPGEPSDQLRQEEEEQLTKPFRCSLTSIVISMFCFYIRLLQEKEERRLKWGVKGKVMNITNFITAPLCRTRSSLVDGVLFSFNIMFLRTLKCLQISFW